MTASTWSPIHDWWIVVAYRDNAYSVKPTAIRAAANAAARSFPRLCGILRAMS